MQMLNCCINHKTLRTAGPPAETSAVEEDEFFDAEESLDGGQDAPMKPTHSAWNQPQGRKERTKMRLLRSNDAVYVPVTQESLPMTEDMVEEQAEMMEQLGHDAEGSELRARILSASLLSDMEAFKVGAFSFCFHNAVALYDACSNAIALRRYTLTRPSSENESNLTFLLCVIHSGRQSRRRDRRLCALAFPS